MPRLDALAWIVWASGMATEAALLVVMVKRNCWRSWPAVFSFVGFKLLTDLFLFVTALEVWGYDRTPVVYFYGYWASVAISELLEVWIIFEIACTVAPTAERILRKHLPILALVYLAGSLYLVVGDPLPFPIEASRVVVSMSRTCSLAWLAAFVCLSAVSEFFGIRWSKRELGVSLGFTVQVIGEVTVSWLLGVFPQQSYALSHLLTLFWVVALALWLYSFLRFEDCAEDIPRLDRLLSIAETLAGLMKSMRSIR